MPNIRSVCLILVDKKYFFLVEIGCIYKKVHYRRNEPLSPKVNIQNVRYFYIFKYQYLERKERVKVPRLVSGKGDWMCISTSNKAWTNHGLY